MGVTTEVSMILRLFGPLVGKVFRRILGHFRQALSDGLGGRQVAETCLLQGAGCLDHVVVRGAEVGPVQHLCKALGEHLQAPLQRFAHIHIVVLQNRPYDDTFSGQMQEK